MQPTLRVHHHHGAGGRGRPEFHPLRRRSALAFSEGVVEVDVHNRRVGDVVHLGVVHDVGVVDRRGRDSLPVATLRLLHDVPIGDILLSTPSRLRAGVEGRTLRRRRVTRPNGEQAELLAALKLTLPERLCADRDVTDPSNLGLPIEGTPPKM